VFVEDVETLGEPVEAQLGVPTVGVAAVEGETETVGERDPLLEVEGHEEELGVTVPHLEGAADLEADIVVLVVLVLEVEPVGETETVLVFELVCVAEDVVEMESEPDAEPQ
jgi:hypothetical protein